MTDPADNKQEVVYKHPWFIAFVCIAVAIVMAYYRYGGMFYPWLLYYYCYFSKTGAPVSGMGGIIAGGLAFYYPILTPLPDQLPETSGTTVVGTVVSILKSTMSVPVLYWLPTRKTVIINDTR